jgi:hypothetical protein
MFLRASSLVSWRRTISEYSFHGMMRRTKPGELNRANGSNLPISKVGIFCLQINDELAHGDGQRSVMILSLRFGWSEEADHAMCIKGISSPPQTSRWQASFLRPLNWRQAIENDGSDPFIQALL